MVPCRHLIVGNERGIHGRVATRLAEIARECDVVLVISRAGGEAVDCSSILDVLSMALVKGTEISMQAEGARAETALSAAADVIIAQDDP